MISETLRAVGLHTEAEQAERIERAVGDLAEQLEVVRARLDRTPEPDPA